MGGCHLEERASREAALRSERGRGVATSRRGGKTDEGGMGHRVGGWAGGRVEGWKGEMGEGVQGRLGSKAGVQGALKRGRSPSSR